MRQTHFTQYFVRTTSFQIAHPSIKSNQCNNCNPQSVNYVVMLRTILRTCSSVPVELVDLIACPLTKTPLRLDAAQQVLANDELGVEYRIRDGIPNLIPTQGRLVDDASQSSKRQ